jgi:hypothetical protein
MANSFTITPPSGFNASTGFQNLDPDNQLTMLVVERTSGTWSTADTVNVNGTSVPFTVLGTDLNIPYDMDNIPAAGDGTDKNNFSALGNIAAGLTDSWKFIGSESITTVVKDDNTLVNKSGVRFPHNTGVESDVMTTHGPEVTSLYQPDPSWGYLVKKGPITEPITVAHPMVQKLIGHKIVTKKKTCFGANGSQVTFETQEVYNAWVSPGGVISLVQVDGSTEYKPCEPQNTAYRVTPNNSSPSPIV